jgi:hypothetical protein
MNMKMNKHGVNNSFLAYKASTDPDTMYHHQAMKQPNREKFQEAMKKECEAHYKEGNYRLIKKRRVTRRSDTIVKCMANEKKKKTIHRRNIKIQSKNEC